MQRKRCCRTAARLVNGKTATVPLAGASSCGVVLSATVPIALTSRADDASSRVALAAMALLLAHHYCLVRP